MDLDSFQNDGPDLCLTSRCVGALRTQAMACKILLSDDHRWRGESQRRVFHHFG
jgi:hypothetical protein